MDNPNKQDYELINEFDNETENSLLFKTNKYKNKEISSTDVNLENERNSIFTSLGYSMNGSLIVPDPITKLKELSENVKFELKNEMLPKEEESDIEWEDISNSGSKFNYRIHT